MPDVGHLPVQHWFWFRHVCTYKQAINDICKYLKNKANEYYFMFHDAASICLSIGKWHFLNKSSLQSTLPIPMTSVLVTSVLVTCVLMTSIPMTSICDLYTYDLCNCDLYTYDHCTCDLYICDLYTYDLCTCDLYICDLYTYDLCNCDLYTYDHCTCDLYICDLYTYDLCTCDLYICDLYTYDLCNCDICTCDLCTCDLCIGDLCTWHRPGRVCWNARMFTRLSQLSRNLHLHVPWRIYTSGRRAPHMRRYVTHAT